MYRAETPGADGVCDRRVGRRLPSANRGKIAPRDLIHYGVRMSADRERAYAGGPRRGARGDRPRDSSDGEALGRHAIIKTRRPRRGIRRATSIRGDETWR